MNELIKFPFLYLADEKHIMLSYNHLSKQPVFAMRDMLRDRGYKVWIDEDQITAGKISNMIRSGLME